MTTATSPYLNMKPRTVREALFAYQARTMTHARTFSGPEFIRRQCTARAVSLAFVFKGAR